MLTSRYRILRCLVSLGLLMAMFFGLAGQVRASVELRQALAELAKEVKKVLDGKGTSEVAIGKFDGPSSNKTAAGPGFSIILQEELTKLGISVREQAKLGLEGRFSLADVPASDPGDARIGKKVLAVKVKLEIVDAFDNRDKLDFERKVLKADERIVPGEATLVRAFGVTTPLDPSATDVQNDAKLRPKIIDRASFHLDNTLIQSAAGQPFAIEILVEGKPATPTPKDGLAFVDIRRGQSYAVRLINRTNFEVGVALFIDGISMFAFSKLRSDDPKRKGEPRYTVVIVPPAKAGKPGEATVRGWHRTNDKGGEDSFLVTEYAKSGAFQLKRTEELGTITATFQAAWEGSLDNAPPGEPGKRRGGLGDATGFGKPTGSGAREVSRNLGGLRDSISVRYTGLKQ